MVVVDPSANQPDGVATELRERFEAQLDEFDGEERVKALAGYSEKVMGDLVEELLDYEEELEVEEVEAPVEAEEDLPEAED
jgi:hypothetical protein